MKGAIADGLRAQLQTQSLVTGQLHVGLDMFPGSPVRLTGRETAVPEIPTVPTTVQQASEQLRGLLTRVQALPVEQLFSGSVEAVNAVTELAESPEIRQTLRLMETTLKDTRSLVRKLDGEMGPLAASARQTLDQARAALDELKVTLGDTQKLVRQTSEQIGPLATSVIRTTDAARATLEKAERSLAGADGLFTEESPLGYRLAQTLDEVADAARSLRSLTGTLERQPSSLLFGRRRARDR